MNAIRSLHLALGADDSIDLTGSFRDGADLGLGHIVAPKHVVTPYLALLDPSGSTRRVTVFPPALVDSHAYRVAVSPSGNAVVLLKAVAAENAFQVADVASTGQILPGTRTFHADRKLSADLPVEPGALTASRLALDRSGNIVLAGPLQGTTNFGSGVIDANASGIVNQTLFLAKIAP